ncbi:hypothetical protein V2J60_02455 [Pseudomonas alliivorans]|nr:hypothetical protein [Pseudomonas alliivorans]
MQLVVGDRLEAMLSYEPQAFQFLPLAPISFGLMVDLQRFHSLGV